MIDLDTEDSKGSCSDKHDGGLNEEVFDIDEYSPAKFTWKEVTFWINLYSVVTLEERARKTSDHPQSYLGLCRALYSHID